MKDISIIPKLQTTAPLPSAKFILNYSAILFTIALVIVIYVAFLVQNISLKKEIFEFESQFAQNEALIKREIGMDSYALGSRLESLTRILAGRLYWSGFLGKEERVFGPEISVKGSDFDMKDFKIIATGTVPSYESLEKLLGDLRNNKDLVSSFSLLESSFIEGSVSFKMEVIFKKELLRGPYTL